MPPLKDITTGYLHKDSNSSPFLSLKWLLLSEKDISDALSTALN